MDPSPGTSFIRLLELQDAGDSSIISCLLKDVDLDSTPVPRYEAASYSWRKDILGSHDNLAEWFPDKFPLYAKQDSNSGTKLIICNDKTLRVQSNLYDFLVRLRAKKRGLPIWIDAICIDQDETNEAARREKMKQLEMMGKIYEFAERVLVWLGETGNISYDFPKTLQKIEKVEVDYESYSTEYDIWKVHKKKKPMRIVPKLGGLAIESLTRLLNRDYFQRAWVVQELVLARDLVFFLGPFELPPEKLLNGIHIIVACGLFPYGEPVSPSDVAGTGFRSMPHMLKAQQDRKDNKPWSFNDFLFICRDREASRPEDKIFSLLGLIDGNMRKRLTTGAITASQGVSLAKIYANCAFALAEDHGWPYVLTLIATGAAETIDLPSFVPDQRVPLKPKLFWYYGCTHFRAAKSVNGDFKLRGAASTSQPSLPWKLTLSAAYIDEIVQVGESHGELLVKQIKYAKGHILDLCSKLGKYYAGTNELSMDAVMRTLTADIFERDREIPLQKLRRAFLGWFGLIIQNMEFEYSDTRTPEQSFFKSTAQGRFAIALHDTGRINGTQVKLPDVVKEFTKIHDNSDYPWVARLSYKLPLILPGEELIGVKSIDEIEKNQGKRRRMVNELESNSPEHFWRYMEQQIGSLAWAMNEIYQSRRIFRTKNRNMVGAGPRDIRLGDVVCLVAGTETTFIFRRVSNGGSCAQSLASTRDLGDVKIVGSAYLHGAMYGELMKDQGTIFHPLNVT